MYRHGKTYSKLFSDKKCNGRDQAFEQAVRYRDDLVAEVAALPDTAPRRRLILHNKGNTSGVVGISRTHKRDRRGVRHEVYAVSWNPEPGVARGTSFSINRYGEHEAFRLACELRWSKMKQIYGDRYDVESADVLIRQKQAVDGHAEARRKRKS